jgi:NitT/TauT family transport system ATP-binding protein
MGGAPGGEIRLSGEPVTGVVADLAVVFQNYSRSLLPWMSVRDDVMFPLPRFRMDRGARTRADDDALDAVDLTQAAGKLVSGAHS